MQWLCIIQVCHLQIWSHITKPGGEACWKYPEWLWLNRSGWGSESLFLSAPEVILMLLVREPALGNHWSKWPQDWIQRFRNHWLLHGEHSGIRWKIGGKCNFISLNIFSGHFRMSNSCLLPNVLLKTFSNIQKSWKNLALNTYIPTT